MDFYDEFEGDVTNILEHMIGSQNEDIERFVKFFEDKIEEGICERTKGFEKSKKSVKLLPDEKAECKKLKAK